MSHGIDDLRNTECHHRAQTHGEANKITGIFLSELCIFCYVSSRDRSDISD
jgi:hypothetical protein